MTVVEIAVESVTFEFTVTPEHGKVSAILDRTETAQSLLVLGHGSGSNMHVPLISGLSAALVNADVATFRYEYPYSNREDFVPYSGIEMDDPEVLLATVRSAIATAVAMAPDLPLFAGGHSVSGQMTSIADADSPLPDVCGIVLLGFPLKGDLGRAAHFKSATKPLLFIQGAADALADVDQIAQVVNDIGAAATLHIVESADHGFTVPDREDGEVIEELARTVADWTIDHI